MAQAPIKVNEETKERIRYLAALIDTTQAEVVDKAVQEYAVRHADLIEKGIDRARSVLAAGDAAIAAHLLGKPLDAVQRVSGGSRAELAEPEPDRFVPGDGAGRPVVACLEHRRGDVGFERREQHVAQLRTDEGPVGRPDADPAPDLLDPTAVGSRAPWSAASRRDPRRIRSRCWPAHGRPARTAPRSSAGGGGGPPRPGPAGGRRRSGEADRQRAAARTIRRRHRRTRLLCDGRHTATPPRHRRARWLLVRSTLGAGRRPGGRWRGCASDPSVRSERSAGALRATGGRSLPDRRTAREVPDRGPRPGSGSSDANVGRSVIAWRDRIGCLSRHREDSRITTRSRRRGRVRSRRRGSTRMAVVLASMSRRGRHRAARHRGHAPDPTVTRAMARRVRHPDRRAPRSLPTRWQRLLSASGHAARGRGVQGRARPRWSTLQRAR